MQGFPEQAIIEIHRIFTFYHFHFATGYVFPGERHPFWEMVYVLNGQVDIGADEQVHVLGAGDVIIVHSVSGRNSVSIDVALRAKEKGAKVIVLTNLAMSRTVTSRHPDGVKLYEVGDVVIDNCGCLGDAAIDVPGVPEKVAPTSTAVGAALMNAMMAQAVADIVDAGGVPPVFVSANVDGGDEHNREMLKRYGSHIFYM